MKQRVLDYLLQVYADQSPEFIYYKTLYELFRRYIEEGKAIDETPKSLSWQLRDKVGTRVRWYEEVEEVDR